MVQFRINPISRNQEQVCISRELNGSCECSYISALDQSFDWQSPDLLLSGYDGVILGGSGDLDFDGNRPKEDKVRETSLALVEQLRPLLAYIFTHDIPTLGICYGHQLLGAFAGAVVHCDATQKKIKSHALTLCVDSTKYFLLANLPDSFKAHYGHKDVLDRVPEGAVLLMSGGESCQVSALQYKNNIYTVQFHPELTYTDMIERMNSSAGYLPEGVLAEEIFSNDPHSNQVLHNFGSLVVGNSSQ